MMKSFGTFTGGAFIYWEYDDGITPVSQLSVETAKTYDTQREMVLFDGGRCHAVAPFEGECYYLVFSICEGYPLLAQKAKKKLVEIGAIWPDEQACAYWDSLLGPTRSARKNIGEGIQCSSVPFISIGQEAITHVFSFTLTPVSMYILCACCRACQDAAYSSNAWRDSVIEAAKIKPIGSRAKSHFKLWTNASAVTTGLWAYQNVAVMLSDIRLWRWVIREEQFGLFVSVSSILKEPAVNFHYRELKDCVAIAFSLEANLRKIANAYLSVDKTQKLCTTPFLKLGPSASCGGRFALQESGVARVNIIGCEFSLATDEERKCENEVTLHVGICYFVAVCRHNIRPCWDIA